MSDETYSGQCICGAIRFRATGRPRYRCYCHCESCRRAIGAPYVAWVTFDADGFTIVDGALAEVTTSPEVVRGFCDRCGTSLTYVHSSRPNDVDITTTSFDDPERFPPQRHVWVRDKLDWVTIDDDLPQFATNSGA